MTACDNTSHDGATTGIDAEGVKVPGSLWSETEALEDRFFGDLLDGMGEEDES